MSPKRSFHDAVGKEEEDRAAKRGTGRGSGVTHSGIQPVGNFAGPTSNASPMLHSHSAAISRGNPHPLAAMAGRRSSDPPGVSALEQASHQLAFAGVSSASPGLYGANGLESNLAMMTRLPVGADPISLNFATRQALLEQALQYLPRATNAANPSFASAFPSLQAAAVAAPSPNSSVFYGIGSLTGNQQALQQWSPSAAGRAQSRGLSGLSIASELMSSLDHQSLPSASRASLPESSERYVRQSSIDAAADDGANARPASAPSPMPRGSSVSNRDSIPLGIDEDPNWLSAFHCFVRTHCLEVCWASREDVAVRNSSKKVLLDQVGLRCRFCVRLPPGSRAPRSAAFPSSVKQIYQSFTMMLRDHFESCPALPEKHKQEYLELKKKPSQGATEAKNYWAFAGKKLGMVDTEDGIIMNDASRAATMHVQNFGFSSEEMHLINAELAEQTFLLCMPEDHQYASQYYIQLLAHFQRIRLLPSERKGNRKTMKAGLPGLGCRHCCQARRFGMSRVFPARRRALPERINDLYDHICRCNLCPEESKQTLRQLKAAEDNDPTQHKTFFDVLWARLGHGVDKKK